MRRLTTTDFIEKATKLHSGFYSYEKAHYVQARDAIIVTCPVHGDFSVRARDHIYGRAAGCSECKKVAIGNALRKDVQTFVADARRVHGDKYNYHHVVYINNSTKVEIECPQHGLFLQKPDKHLCQESGCPGCGKSGYKSGKPGWLYVLRDGCVTKVGITNRKVAKRVKEINGRSGTNFQPIYVQFFEDGRLPPAFELILLNKLKAVYEQPTEIHDGSTECFLDVDREDLLRSIQVLNTENKTHLTTS